MYKKSSSFVVNCREDLPYKVEHCRGLLNEQYLRTQYLLDHLIKLLLMQKENKGGNMWQLISTNEIVLLISAHKMNEWYIYLK